MAAELADTAIINTIKGNMASWDHWAFWAKVVAVVLGSLISALGTLVAAKQLPDKWHYGSVALAAATGFAWSTLQPYEEYKQFRAAYASVEAALMTYQAIPTTDNMKALIGANEKARNMLAEKWSPPDPVAAGAPPKP
jgi:hypothetical protein